MRKSPIRHLVRQYKKRTGKTVDTYTRGHGEKKVKVSKPKFHRKDKVSSSNYHVKLTYVSLPSESYPVPASSYPDAIELALLARSHITPPVKIEVHER